MRVVSEHPNDSWRADMTDEDFVEWLAVRERFRMRAAPETAAMMDSQDLVIRNYRPLSEAALYGREDAERSRASLDEFFPFAEDELLAVGAPNLTLIRTRRHDGAGNELLVAWVIRFEGPQAAEAVFYGVEDLDKAEAEFERWLRSIRQPEAAPAPKCLLGTGA